MCDDYTAILVPSLGNKQNTQNISKDFSPWLYQLGKISFDMS